MANILTGSITTASAESELLGRVSFLMTRPDLDAVYPDFRPPGSLFAYYEPANGFAELYVVDPSGYKFMALG